MVCIKARVANNGGAPSRSILNLIMWCFQNHSLACVHQHSSGSKLIVKGSQPFCDHAHEYIASACEIPYSRGTTLNRLFNRSSSRSGTGLHVNVNALAQSITYSPCAVDINCFIYISLLLAIPYEFVQ